MRMPLNLRGVASIGLSVLLAAGCGTSDKSVTSNDESAANAEAAAPRWTPPAVVETPEFAFTREDACDSEGEASATNVMTLKRTNGVLELGVDAAVYCSSVAAYPAVSFLRDLVTVSVMDYSLTTDGTATACMCSNELHFAIKRDVPKGTRIVFLVDGNAMAEGEAP